MNRYCLELQEGHKKYSATTHAGSTRVAVNRFLEILTPPLEVLPGELRHFDLVITNQGRAARYGRYEWEALYYDRSRESYKLQESRWLVRGEPVPEGWEPFNGAKPGLREAKVVTP